MEILVVELPDNTAVRRFERGLPGFRLLNPWLATGERPVRSSRPRYTGPAP